MKSSEDVSEDDPSNLDYRFYKLFHPLIAPRSPGAAPEPGSVPASPHPGKAVSVERPEARPVTTELPAIHSSPAKGQIQIV